MELGRGEFLVSAVFVIALAGILIWTYEPRDKAERVVEKNLIAEEKLNKTPGNTTKTITVETQKNFQYPDMKLNDTDLKRAFDNPVIFSAFGGYQKIQLLLGKSRYGIYLSQGRFVKTEKMLLRNPSITITATIGDWHDFIISAQQDGRENILEAYEALDVAPDIEKMNIQDKIAYG